MPSPPVVASAAGTARVPAVALAVREVSKSYGVTRALSGVSLEIRSGEVHSLVGGNGSGKSTLIKILAGVVPADGGELTVRGAVHDLRRFDPMASRRSGLHLVHQHRTTFDALSVTENLSIGRGFEISRTGRISWRAARRRAAELIERFGIDARPDDLAGDLSPTAQTLLEIARALQDQDGATDDVLILDEPTAALPPHEAEELLAALRRFAAAGQGVVFVSHRLDEVLAVSDRVTALRDGVVVAISDAEGLARDDLVELMVGRAVAPHRAEADARDAAEPVLTADGLTGGRIRDLDLAVGRGEIVGVAGAAGSGRSTLLRLLFGAQRTEAGHLLLRGSRVVFRTPADAVAAGLALVPEDRPRDAMFAGMSVAENLSVARLGRYTTAGTVRHGRERAAARTAIDRFGVRTADERVPVGSLSGGNQQKVSVARWLDPLPAVLLLDEPTQGVDVGARAELWDMVGDAARRGTAVVLVSSDLEELVHLAHRIVLLREGTVAGVVENTGLTAESVNRTLHSLEIGT